MVVLLILLVGVGGVLALQFLRGSDDGLAAHVPDDAVVYAHLNLNPSAANKLGISRLIDRINEAAGEDLIDIDSLLDDIEMDADGVSFDDDIDPWLGDQVAVYAIDFPAPAVDSPETEDPVFAVVVAVDDTDAAVDFVEDQDPVGDWDAGGGRQGWLVDGEDADDADAVVVAIDGDRFYIGVPAAVRAGLDTETSLADADRFSDAVGALPDRVVTLWADAPAFIDAVVASSGQMMPAGEDIPDAFAMGISFSDGAVDITTVATGASEVAEDEQIAPADLASLPAGGIIYARVPNLGPQLPRLLEGADDSARETAEQFGDPLSEDELPSVQADRELAELFGTSVAEISGWMGDLTMMVAYDPSRAADNAAMLLQVAVSDEEAAAALIDTAATDLAGEEGVEVSAGRVESGDVSLGVADGAMALTVGTPSGDVLGDDEAFQAAVDGIDGEAVFYVDVRAMVEAIAAFAVPPGGADATAQQVADVAAAFDSIVATYLLDGDVIRSGLRISFASELRPVTIGVDEPNLPDLDFGPLGTFEAVFGGGGDIGGMFDPPPTAASPEEELSELEIDLSDAAFQMETDFLVDGAYVFPNEPFPTFLPGSFVEAAVVQPDAYCLVGFTPSGVPLIHDSVSGSATQPAGDPYAACEEAVGGAAATPTPPPDQTGAAFTYGDDPALDALWDACAAGDFAACDQLFNQSAEDSDYELFALTCGDRNDPSAEFCVDVYPDGQ